MFHFQFAGYVVIKCTGHVSNHL